jgi:hypothetical protein
LPSGGAALERLSCSGSLQHYLSITPTSDLENGSQEERFLRSRIRNMGFLLAECQLEFFPQKRFDFLFDVLCQSATPTYPDHPIVGISQVFDPDKIGIIYLCGWRGPHPFEDLLEFLGLRFPTVYHALLPVKNALVARISVFRFPLL